MNCKSIRLFLLLALLSVIATVGCGSSAQKTTVQPTVAAVVATATSVKTSTPTFTETPISTLTSSPTSTPTATLTPTPKPTIPLQGLHGVPYPPTDLLAGRKPDTLIYVVKEIKFAQSRDLSSIRIWGNDPAKKQPILAAWYNEVGNEWRWKEFGLGDLADVLGMTFGIAIDGSRQRNLDSAADVALLIREPNLVLADDGFEWRYLRPSLDRFNWNRADLVINFARQNGKRVRGHPLIESEPERMPTWLLQKVESDRQSLATNSNDASLQQKIRNEYVEMLTTHIKTVMGRYKDRMSEWTILNEVFDDAGKFRADNFWYQFIGDDYPEIAVRTAREVDPNAVLIINDYFLQDQNSPKLKAYLNLIKALKDKGLFQERDGLGFQGHTGILDPRTKETYKDIFRSPVQLGVSVYITELDIFNVYTNDPQTFNKQAQLYERIARACLELNDDLNKSVCRSITIWGYKDNDSWILWADPKPSYPLLFSATLEKKPAYDAIFTAFLESATK
jgi:endo-1,4-beta-xylanase